jgi:ribose-phosphate pyrophosphokinase
VEAARALRARGAASVSALVTHALFVGDALVRMQDAGIGDISSTDSVCHDSNRIRLAGLLAAALDEGTD